MYDSPNYPVEPAAADAFVAGQRHGTLVAAAPGGFPQVSVLPFVKEGGVVECHCVRADPTFAAVRANPRVTFLVSDFLAFSPHHWVDPEDAARGTLHFRAVAFEGTATVTTDPGEVAAALARLLAAYEPGARHRPLADDDFYGPRLRRLAAVRIAVERTHAKFKVGPAGPAEEKLAVVRGLRERAQPGDARAADVIAATLAPPAAGRPR